MRKYVCSSAPKHVHLPTCVFGIRAPGEVRDQGRRQARRVATGQGFSLAAKGQGVSSATSGRRASPRASHLASNVEVSQASLPRALLPRGLARRELRGLRQGRAVQASATSVEEIMRRAVQASAEQRGTVQAAVEERGTVQASAEERALAMEKRPHVSQLRAPRGGTNRHAQPGFARWVRVGVEQRLP